MLGSVALIDAVDSKYESLSRGSQTHGDFRFVYKYVRLPARCHIKTTIYIILSEPQPRGIHPSIDISCFNSSVPSIQEALQIQSRYNMKVWIECVLENLTACSSNLAHSSTSPLSHYLVPCLYVLKLWLTLQWEPPLSSEAPTLLLTSPSH